VAISVPLRGAGGAGGNLRTVRVLFPEALEPEAHRTAMREAAREYIRLRHEGERAEAEEAQRRQESKRKRPPKKRPRRPAERGEPAKPGPDGEEVIPPALGTVDRAGRGRKIRIRVNLGARVSPDETLRVRKDGRWCGRVRMQRTLVGMTDSGKQHTFYWVHIFEGHRERLIGGSIHRDKSLRRRP
jgi:hypothetical protein